MSPIGVPNKLLFFLLASVALVLLVVLAVPEWKMHMRGALWPQSKALLARVEGDLWGSGERFEVLKFQQGRGLSVEVRQIDSSGNPSFVDRMIIPDRYSSHFDIQGRATQLALMDLDGDRELEIIAPSIDDRMNTHLNVLRLSKSLKRLEIVRGHTLN